MIKKTIKEFSKACNGMKNLIAMQKKTADLINSFKINYDNILLLGKNISLGFMCASYVYHSSSLFPYCFSCPFYYSIYVSDRLIKEGDIVIFRNILIKLIDLRIEFENKYLDYFCNKNIYPLPTDFYYIEKVKNLKDEFADSIKIPLHERNW